MSQARRLLELYDRLLTGSRLDNRYIREQYNLTRRQATRDLALLDDVLGARLTRIRDGGGRTWWHLQDREHRRTVLAKQVFAVAVGSKLAGFLAGRLFEPAARGILDRLTRDLRATQQSEVNDLLDRIHVIRTGQKRYDEHDAPQTALTAMVQGLLLDLQLDLTYQSHRRARTGAAPRSLRVAPLTMVLYRSAVYFVVDVLGGDWSGPGRILLALDRVQAASLTDESFPRPSEFSVEQFFAEAFAVSTAGPTNAVVLRISAELAPYVEERFWHPSTRHRWLDDGRLHLELRVRGSEVLEWVRNMGPHVEVVAPAALRDQMKRDLQATLAHYRD